MAVEPPLVSVKLTPPSPPTPAVPRPRLDDRLAVDAGGALTLVTGPTGAGKTALLAGWFASATTRRSWLSLDVGDNDPVRFWTYVIAALQRLEPSLGSRAVEVMRESGIDRRLLASLLEDASELPAPTTLVLDDFQVIADPSILDSVGWAVEHLPAQMHLVIASRVEPPFRLPRLRLTGRLHEVREADLRFRPDEARALLDGLVAGVGADDAAVLTSRTEGWAAGLQLAGLSLREHPDPSGFVRRFAGSTRIVADLLVDEVLDRQSPEVRDFLLHTSVLDRFSAGLCDAVTDRRDSARVLHELDEANLFLVPLDDEHRWYRYHQLFAELLRSELQASDPEGARRAHAVAGAWYEAEGHPSSALRQHLAAGALDRAWGVVVDYFAAYYLAERHGTIREWLRAVPQDYLAADPIRSIDAGTAALLAGDLDQAGAWALTAERALERHADERAPSRLALLRGMTAWHLGEPVSALADLEQVRGSLGDQWWPVLGELDVGLMVARAALLLGELERATAALDDLPPGRRGFDDVLVLILRAHVALAAGELREVEVLTEKSRDELAALDQQVGILLCDLCYLSGSLHLERGRIAESLVDLQAALAQAVRAGGRESIVSITVALARGLAAAGRTAEARTSLRNARTALGPQADGNPLAAMLAVAECRLGIASGRLEAAGRALEQVPAGPQRTRLEVRLHLAAGRSRMAAPLLAEVTDAAATVREEVTDELLTSLALAGRDDERALEHLARAVEIAGPEGYVTVFVEEGPRVLALLHRLAGTRSSPALDHLLREVDAAPPEPRVELPPLGVGRLVEPLSDREIGVLRYLPSPLPYREIARELYISPNTLKTHMKNLYRKLEVGSRSEAVARARSLELL